MQFKIEIITSDHELAYNKHIENTTVKIIPILKMVSSIKLGKHKKTLHTI